MKKNFFKTKQILAFLFLLDFFVFIVGTFIFWNIIKMGKTISILENDININIKQEKDLNSLEKMITDVRPYVANFDKFFVGNDEDVVVFINNIESIGRSMDVKTIVDSVQNDTTSKNSLRLKISFSGTWKNVIKFIGVVESMPYKNDVQNLSMAFEESDDKSVAGLTPSPKNKVVKINLWRGYVDFIVLRNN